ncbi:MAG: N-acetylglucosaminyl-diphospho-decaprenol L-rhamnosyltransferase [Frankiaceae bacterium]|jgi:GT2 family glycosyltransferase|nr:N-acetylglucosaminyl-diphospho-decaprenol L-rhamnosyltransferase [Frankiaceae bacterium]
MPERTGAVVVHHRNWPGVSDTLHALLAAPLDRVVLVDDASGDGSAPAIREAWPGVEVIEQAANLGYAAAANTGLRRLAQTGCDTALLVTHEVLLDGGAVAALGAALTGDVVAAGPLLAYRDRPEVVWSAGGLLTAPPEHVGQGEPIAAWSGRPPYDVDWLDGACLLLRLDAVAAAGWLDESYFLYVEELDLLWRLRQAGGRVVVVPAARAWQQPSFAPPYLQARNLTRFARRAGRPDIARSVLRLAAGHLRHARDPDQRWRAYAMLRGVLDACSGRLDRSRALRR